MKTFTLRQVAEALIADSTPKAKGSFFRTSRMRSSEHIAESEVESGRQEVYDPAKDAYVEVVPDEPHFVGATCAIGGAAYVLRVNASALLDALNSIDCSLGLTPRSKVYQHSFIQESHFAQKRHPLGNFIYGLNDDTDATKADIGRRIIEKCASLLDVEMTAQEVVYHAKFAMKSRKG